MSRGGAGAAFLRLIFPCVCRMNSLSDHEKQLAAVDAAISRDPTNDEWQRLRADLLEVHSL